MKKIFTLIAAALMTMGANAQAKWWKATGDAISAGTTIVDDDVVTASTVFETTTQAKPVTILNEEFSGYFQIRVAADPTADVPTGTDNGGSTPLIVKANKDCTFTAYTRRQKGNDGYNAGDNKALLCVNQADLQNVAAVETFDKFDGDGEDYGFVSDAFDLKAGNTYTFYRRGSTMQCYGFSYEAAEGGSTGGGSTSNANHAVWEASSLPQSFEAGIDAGFGNVWDTYLATPADYTLCETDGFRAYFELPTLLGPGNGNYSGKAYGMKPLMGMKNSSRDGIDPLNFFEGLENNDYVRTNSDATHGVDYTDAIVTLKVAAEADGGRYGMITLTYNRGGNLSAMYVVDATAKNGEGMMVLQSRTRCPDENIQSHVAKFGVEPGHTYYIMASEAQSVELYKLEYDAVVADDYETLNAKENFAAYWDAASLPADFNAGIEAGFGNVWDTYLATPADYTLCETDGFRAYFELPTLLGPGNGGYSGKAYGMKPLMGMKNSSRDGIDPLNFFEGLDNNDYVRTNSDATHGVDYTDAIVTMKVATEDEGGKYGKVSLNYNRGGNLSAMYVVDATAKNGEGMMVLQSRTRCPDDAVKTHTAQFGVEPGHTYYVIASEAQSVELYSVGFCPVTAENYYAGDTATGIENVVVNKKSPKSNIMYNLAGQRIAAPVSGQIYILNGKKYIAK